MRYRFIFRNKSNHSVEQMCKCMRISKNAYYHWAKTKDLNKIKASKVFLKNRIEYHFYKSKEIYGSYRIHKKLEQEGLIYSRSYIGFLMQEMGFKSVLKRKFITTTDSNHSNPISKNQLNRAFSCSELGKKWVSDITYIRVHENWNYLTIIIDLADRKVVGWSLSEDMTVKNTVKKAWMQARRTRAIMDGFIFHSDRGVQYTSKDITKYFKGNQKITQSMSRKGNCWDNAVAESFFKTIKYEWLNRFKYRSNLQLYDSLKDYINWYNNERLHSSLGYLSPLEMEQVLRRKTNKAA